MSTEADVWSAPLCGKAPLEVSFSAISCFGACQCNAVIEKNICEKAIVQDHDLNLVFYCIVMTDLAKLILSKR